MASLCGIHHTRELTAVPNSRSGMMTVPFFQSQRWRQGFTDVGLVSTPERLWRGVYRGRALTLGFQGRALTLAARTRNPARLLDQLDSNAPLPKTPWLTTLAALELTAFVQPPGEPERWQLQVQGEQLQLTCRTARPTQLRFLLDLVCDVAEGIDEFGEGH